MKFCDLPVGTQFEFQGEVYIKTTPLVARHLGSEEQKFFRRASLVQTRAEPVVSKASGKQKQFSYTQVIQAMDELLEQCRGDVAELQTIRHEDIERILQLAKDDFLRKFA